MVIEILYEPTRQNCYISCDCSNVVTVILSLFKNFTVEEHDDTITRFNHIDLSIERKGDRYEILGKDGVYSYCELLGIVVREILEKISAENERFFFLHGGCVANKKGLHLFLGKTKSGKSTIVYTLCEIHGLQYITDDLIGINEFTECTPFKKPIFIRDKSKIVTSEIITISYEDEKRYCFLPSENIDVSCKNDIAAIYILVRGEPFHYEELSVSEAFINIWQNMHSSENIMKKRNAAMLLAKQVKVYKLYYSDVNEDINDFLKLLHI